MFRLVKKIISRTIFLLHRYRISKNPLVCNIYGAMGLRAALTELYMGRSSSLRIRKKQLEKLNNIRNKDKITVAFQVWQIGKWKCDSVYKAMEKSSRFSPLIWVAEDPALPTEFKKDVKNNVYQYFLKKNYICSVASTWEELYKCEKPDIVFIQEPYAYGFNMPPYTLNRLLCYVRYGLPNTLTEAATNRFLHNYCLLYFCENKFIAESYGSLMNNKGRNIAITGHPVVDYLTSAPTEAKDAWRNCKSGVKKVIWAPHWTIGNQSFYCASTFLLVSDVMLKIAQRYADSIRIAFKPHPTLKRELYRHPKWGKEKTDAYFEQWATMSNTLLAEGDYRELFRQSDAIIHDSGSFLLEYLLMDKPCMYLLRDDGKPNFNDMNIEALQCYTIGKTEEDIERFIQDQVLGGQDFKSEKRKAFCKKYLIPPHEKTAAENILDAILGNPPYNTIILYS